MPIDPDQRRHLASVMEDRRLELRLTWQDVAERGDISLRALSSARTGEGDIRPLTRRGIDRGLRWIEGAGVDRILAGHDPVPAGLAAAPDPARAQAEDFAREHGIDPADEADPRVRAVREEVRRAIEAHGPDVAGTLIFHGRPLSKSEALLWDTAAGASRESKILMVAGMRADLAEYDAGRSASGTRHGTTGLALRVIAGDP